MSNNQLQEIKRSVEELQQRLGRQLQVTIYKDLLNEADDLQKAASDCRMSISNSEYTPGNKSDNPTYAVHVVAEGLGEIPYALMCEEAYLIGERSEESD